MTVEGIHYIQHRTNSLAWYNVKIWAASFGLK